MNHTSSLAGRIALRTALILASISALVLFAEWTVLRSVASANISVTPEDSAAAPEVVEAVFQLASGVIATILTVSAIALLAITAIGALLSYRAARASLQRVAEIDAHTRRITASTLDERLKLPGPRDEIKQLADTIDETLDRLDAAFAQQERFAANASHELRTPLTVLQSSLEALGVKNANEPEIARSLRSVRRMNETIDALLLLAQTKRLPVEHGFPVDLAAVVHIVHEDTEPRFSEKGISVDIRAAHPVYVHGDQTLLVQAVHNLIQNAANYAPSGGSAVFEAVSVNEEAVLIFSNNGPVLDEGEAARLLEPFNRGEDSRISGRPGHGLGLSIVNSIVRQHGGNFSLSARGGGGVVVEARIPLAKGEAKAEAGDTAPASVTAVSSRVHR